MNAAESHENDVPRVAAAVIVRDGLLLIAKRKKGDRFEGRWEFPGGKVETGESPEEALKRELREELGIETEIREFVCFIPVRTPELRIDLIAFKTAWLSGDPVCRDHEEIRWIGPEEVDNFNFTPPDRFVLNALFPVREEPGKAGGPDR
jgi:8-oxo-dGTP diphosphatase